MPGYFIKKAAKNLAHFYIKPVLESEAGGKVLLFDISKKKSSFTQEEFEYAWASVLNLGSTDAYAKLLLKNEFIENAIPSNQIHLAVIGINPSAAWNSWCLFTKQAEINGTYSDGKTINIMSDLTREYLKDFREEFPNLKFDLPDPL